MDRATGSGSERLQWSNRWKGTYRRAGRKLVLSLRLKERSCKKVLERTRRGEVAVTKTQHACPRPRRRLKLRCVEDKVDARLREDRLSSKITVLPAWRCRPAGDRPTYGSSAPWLFGKKHCLISITRYRHFYDVCD